jgi:paraquat-inducible protein B
MPSPADMDVRTHKPPLRGRISLVWIVPLIALIVSLTVAWNEYRNRGVLIEISFVNASGITEETVIKYRDVNIGKVEELSFAPDLKSVLVSARINSDIWPFLDDDANFWVVRPDVSVRGISGLETVLSGVYIEGTWDNQPDVAQYYFTGLESPVVTDATNDGLLIELRAPHGGALNKGAPILHKGIAVGYLEAPQLLPNGSGVQAFALIEAPHDKLITTATRFWDTSGFSVSVGSGGLALNVDSLASLIEGGIAFDTIVSGGVPVGPGNDIFDIYDDEESARNSLFLDPDRQLLEVAMLFDENISGLSAGATVRFRGVQVGEVKTLGVTVAEENGAQAVRLRATVLLEPARFGLNPDVSEDNAFALLQDLVAQGLRARMATDNILSGSLLVELIELDDAPLAQIDQSSDALPLIPTTSSDITDVAATAEDVLARIERLPIEELMQSTIDLMQSANTLARSESLQKAPDELLGTLTDMRAIIASDAVQEIPVEISAMLGQIDEAIANLRDLTQQAVDGDIIGELSNAITVAQTAALSLDEGTDNLPNLLQELEALAITVNTLEIAGLVDQTTATLANIDQLVASEAAQAVPASLAASLDEIRALVTDLRHGGALEDLNTALTSANEAAKAVEQAATELPNLSGQASDLLTNIDTALIGLPRVISELETLVMRANTVEIEALVAQTTATLDAIETLVASEDTAALPGSLTAALADMRAVLSDIREGGAIDNANAALRSASDAAQAIEEAASSLPALSQRANALVAQTSTVIDTYSARSRFNTETLSALRDIQAAADAITALARTIQRNPSALLTGR